MIYIDIDNVCIDFTGTLRRHFGIELANDDFETFHWQDFSPNIHCEKCRGKHGGIPTPCKFPAPQEFYAKAELMPWHSQLLIAILLSGGKPIFITKDYAELKRRVLFPLQNCDCCNDFKFIEEPNKSNACGYPCDLLLDDNPAQIEAWRAKGGLAFWFDNSKPDIFEQFLKWWRLER
jgi:hypothetical protein